MRVLELVEEVADRPAHGERDADGGTDDEPADRQPERGADDEHPDPAQHGHRRERPRRVDVVLEVLAAHDPLALALVHREAVQHVLGEGPQQRAEEHGQRQQSDRHRGVLSSGRSSQPSAIARAAARSVGSAPHPRRRDAVSSAPRAAPVVGRPVARPVDEQRAVERHDPGERAHEVAVDRLGRGDRPRRRVPRARRPRPRRRAGLGARRARPSPRARRWRRRPPPRRRR